MPRFVEVANQGRYVLDETMSLVFDAGDQQVFRSCRDGSFYLQVGGCIEAIDRDEADDVMREVAGVPFRES